MKLIKPSGPSGSSRKTPGRPEWMKEWLANKGRYAVLECGHMIDLNDKTIQPLIAYGGKAVLCEIHGIYRKITGPVTFHEFAGYEVKPDPGDIPPF